MWLLRSPYNFSVFCELFDLRHRTGVTMGRASDPTPGFAACSRRVNVPGRRLLVDETGALRTRLQSALEVPSKASRIFKDYVLGLYFPANRLSWPQRLRCAPPLLLVEYLVYKVDSVTEGAQNVDLDATKDADYDALFAYKAKFEKFLRRMNAYNRSVARQIEMGEQYVRIENKVTSNRVVDHGQVMRLAELRPSDVRLLHSMIFALLSLPCDDDLQDLLWPVEVLADIGNDLAHYRADITGRRFNTYAMLVELYGRAAPERIRAEIAHYEKLFRAGLAKFPEGRRTELEELCAKRYRGLTVVVPEPLPQSGYLSVRNEERS